MFLRHTQRVRNIQELTDFVKISEFLYDSCTYTTSTVVVPDKTFGIQSQQYLTTMYIMIMQQPYISSVYQLLQWNFALFCMDIATKNMNFRNMAEAFVCAGSQHNFCEFYSQWCWCGGYILNFGSSISGSNRSGSIQQWKQLLSFYLVHPRSLATGGEPGRDSCGQFCFEEIRFLVSNHGFIDDAMANIFYTTYYFYYLLDPTHLLFQLSPKASHQRRRSLLLLRFQSTLLSFSLVWLASSTSSPSTKDLKLNCRELGFWQRITRHFTTTASHITKKAVVWHWQKAATF